jgi:hypothetical protein
MLMDSRMDPGDYPAFFGYDLNRDPFRNGWSLDAYTTFDLDSALYVSSIRLLGKWSLLTFEDPAMGIRATWSAEQC